METSTVQPPPRPRAAKHRRRRRPSAEGIGDGVPAEAGSVTVPHHEAPGGGGVVPECHPPGRLPPGAVPGDRQPHPGAGPGRSSPPAPGPSCSRARGRAAGDHHVGPGHQRAPADDGPTAVPESTDTDSFAPFSRSKNSGDPSRAPSGRDVVSTLTTRQPALWSRAPASGPAHRADRSTTNRSPRSPGTGAPRWTIPSTRTPPRGRPGGSARAPFTDDGGGQPEQCRPVEQVPGPAAFPPRRPRRPNGRAGRDEGAAARRRPGPSRPAGPG